MSKWIEAERLKEPGWELPVAVIRDDETGDLVCEIPYPDQPEHQHNATLIIAAPALMDLRDRLNALITERYPDAWGEDLVTATGEYIDRLHDLLATAEHALRSYQYGNGSPDLAKMVADKIAREKGEK